ncbi:MAG: hypothetical protein AB7I33_13370 [Gemmatimonadales bacterium]
MKLVDTDETIILVTGADIRAEERDRPIAYRLKREIDQRGVGHAFRRAVVVGDAWYLNNRIFHLNPTIAIGGPGVNGVSADFASTLPTIWSQEERAYIQADFEGDLKRAALWGMDQAATSDAVDGFVIHGFLDELLRKIWRFRTEVYV